MIKIKTLNFMKNTKNKFLIKIYKTTDFNSHKDILNKCSKKFFNKILFNFRENKFFILLKVKYENDSILSFHKGIIANKKSGFAEMII
jgi:hypothetical protein